TCFPARWWHNRHTGPRRFRSGAPDSPHSDKAYPAEYHRPHISLAYELPPPRALQGPARHGTLWRQRSIPCRPRQPRHGVRRPGRVDAWDGGHRGDEERAETRWRWLPPVIAGAQAACLAVTARVEPGAHRRVARSQTAVGARRRGGAWAHGRGGFRPSRRGAGGT